ncbi:MAG TPA: MarR family transcriptional regulator [Longimicrobiales bacterium]
MTEGTRRVGSVADDIRQTAPFRSTAQEALIALLRTANEARRHLNAAVAPEGITLQQYNVLRILRGAGPGGLPTLDVSNRMLEREPGVTRIIDRLAGKDLVERERCRNDRRRVWCRITDEGRAVLDRLERAVDRADRDVSADLTPTQLEQVITLLDLMRGRLKSSGR